MTQKDNDSEKIFKDQQKDSEVKPYQITLNNSSAGLMVRVNNGTLLGPLNQIHIDGGKDGYLLSIVEKSNSPKKVKKEELYGRYL